MKSNMLKILQQEELSISNDTELPDTIDVTTTSGDYATVVKLAEGDKLLNETLIRSTECLRLVNKALDSCASPSVVKLLLHDSRTTLKKVGLESLLDTVTVKAPGVALESIGSKIGNVIRELLKTIFKAFAALVKGVINFFKGLFDSSKDLPNKFKSRLKKIEELKSDSSTTKKKDRVSFSTSFIGFKSNTFHDVASGAKALGTSIDNIPDKLINSQKALTKFIGNHQHLSKLESLKDHKLGDEFKAHNPDWSYDDLPGNAKYEFKSEGNEIVTSFDYSKTGSNEEIETPELSDIYNLCKTGEHLASQLLSSKHSADTLLTESKNTVGYADTIAKLAEKQKVQSEDIVHLMLLCKRSFIADLAHYVRYVGLATKGYLSLIDKSLSAYS